MVVVVAAIVLGFFAALSGPAFADRCNKGQGRQGVCDPYPVPECPPCKEFDFCVCKCMTIPGCRSGH
jgi:hypothetical protein